MLEALFTVGLMVAIPIVYFQGKRAGFERHHCVRITDYQDRAPQTFVTVAGCRLTARWTSGGRSPAGSHPCTRRSTRRTSNTTR